MLGIFVAIPAIIVIHLFTYGYQNNVVLGKDYVDPPDVQAADIQSSPECQEKQATAQKLIAPIQAKEDALGNIMYTEKLPISADAFNAQYTKYSNYQNQISNVETQYNCQNGN